MKDNLVCNVLFLRDRSATQGKDVGAIMTDESMHIPYLGKAMHICKMFIAAGAPTIDPPVPWRLRHQHAQT